MFCPFYVTGLALHLRVPVGLTLVAAHLAAGQNNMNLDPGALGVDDQLQNLRAVREATRVFSAYELRDGIRIWIITEALRDHHPATRGVLAES